MNGLWKRSKFIVKAHWFVPMLDYESSVDEFYGSIEREIAAHNFPNVIVSRLLFPEAGVFSANREYLRIRRENLLFDIGAGPLGDCWYYSCRGSILPRTLKLWEILVALAILGSLGGLYINAFGLTVGLIVLGTSALAVVSMMTQAGKWPGSDEFLVNLPVVGGIYEVFFRVETFCRQDTRHTFWSILNHMIREKVKEDALARGRQDLVFTSVDQVAQPMGVKDLILDGIQQMSGKAAREGRV